MPPAGPFSPWPAHCKLWSQDLAHPIRTFGGLWLKAIGMASWEENLSHTHHSGRSQSLPRLGGVSTTKFRSSIPATVQKANTTQAPSSQLPPPSRVCLPSHLPHAAFLILPQLCRSLPFLHPFQHLGPGTQYLVCTSMVSSPQFPYPWL